MSCSVFVNTLGDSTLSVQLLTSPLVADIARIWSLDGAWGVSVAREHPLDCIVDSNEVRDFFLGGGSKPPSSESPWESRLLSDRRLEIYFTRTPSREKTMIPIFFNGLLKRKSEREETREFQGGFTTDTMQPPDERQLSNV